MLDAFVIARAMTDPGLKPPHFRLAVVWCQLHLDWHEYRYVKAIRLAAGIRCSEPQAFVALRTLERLGYLVSSPASRRPRLYRLANPEGRENDVTISPLRTHVA